MQLFKYLWTFADRGGRILFQNSKNCSDIMKDQLLIINVIRKQNIAK